MLIYPLTPAEQKTVRWSGFGLFLLAVSTLTALAAISFAG